MAVINSPATFSGHVLGGDHAVEVVGAAAVDLVVPQKVDRGEIFFFFLIYLNVCG